MSERRVECWWSVKEGHTIDALSGGGFVCRPNDSEPRQTFLGLALAFRYECEFSLIPFLSSS